MNPKTHTIYIVLDLVFFSSWSHFPLFGTIFFVFYHVEVYRVFILRKQKRIFPTIGAIAYDFQKHFELILDDVFFAFSMNFGSLRLGEQN